MATQVQNTSKGTVTLNANASKETIAAMKLMGFTVIMSQDKPNPTTISQNTKQAQKLLANQARQTFINENKTTPVKDTEKKVKDTPPVISYPTVKELEVRDALIERMKPVTEKKVKDTPKPETSDKPKPTSKDTGKNGATKTPAKDKVIYSRLDSISLTLLNKKPKTTESWAKMANDTYINKGGKDNLHETKVLIRYLTGLFNHFSIAIPKA